MDGFDGNIELGVKLTPTDIKKTAAQLRKEIESVFEGSAGKKTSKQFQRMETQLDKLYGRSEKLHRSLKELEDTKLPTAEYKAVEKEFDTVSNSIQKTGKLIEDLQAKLDASSTSRNRKAAIATQIESQEKELERLYTQLDKIEAKRDALRASGKDYISGTETQEYRNTANELNNVNNQIVQVISAVNKLRSDEEGLPEPVNKTSKAAETLKSSMSKVLTIIEKAVKAYGKMLLLIGKGLVVGAKKLLGQFRDLNKHTDKHQLSLKKMTRMLLKYGLGIRSVYILWRKLRGYVTETIKAMAKQFSDVNADVSMLMNAFNQMKAGFGSMAQPLLHALAPALTYIINLITTALNALGNFFAILTGQKFVYKATKQNKDYAKSVGGVGKAADDANEKLAEYDNLIVIQQDSGSGGGGGGTADAYAGAWEKVEAESDFAQKLKDAINSGDWEGVGGIFAEKLNSLTDTFDNWLNNTFRPKGKLWADRIGRILNGLTDGFNAKKLGNTLADGVNAIFDIFNTFLKRYNFKKLGTRVGEAITGFFTRLDPKLIGNTLANKFNAAINFWGGLIKSTDFKVIGSRIGVALKTLIEDIQWADLGADLSNLATGILEGLSQFIVDSDLGVTVGNAINQFLSKIDFGRLMRDLSELAINILNALADAIETVDWEMVGQAIADMLKNIDWGRFLTALVRVALGLIKGLGTALLQIATDPEALGSLATGLLAIFGAKWIWSKITGLFKTGLTGAITQGAAGAGSATAGLGAALFKGWALFEAGSSLAGSIGSVISYAFDDELMSAEYQKMAKAPTQYLVSAISTAVEAASEYSETTGKTTLQNAIGDMLGYGVDPMELAKENSAKMQADSWEAFQRAKLGWGTEKGGLGLGREVTDLEWFAYRYGETVNQLKESSNTLAQDTNSAFSGVGKALNGMATEMEKAVSEGQKSLGLYTTDSSHYAEIAKNNAIVVRDTVKLAEQSSNHYVEIAKQNSGYYDKIKAETEATSNHYVQIAQANAQAVTNTAKEAEASSNHYVEIAKANAQAVQASHKEMEDASTHYVGVAKQNVDDAIENANRMATEIENSVSGIPDSYDKTFSSAYEKVTGAFDGTKSYFQQVAEGVKAPFGTMGEYFDDTFTDAWGNVVDVFQTDTPQFQSIQDSISGSFKTMINGMITGVNNSITSPFQTLGNLVNRLRGMTVGDNKIFAGLPSINVPKIPKLAQGAVLPPNNPFIAMVGDQKSGTNIETPLDTMVEAFRQAMRESGGESHAPIILNLNGKQIAQAVWDEENKRYKQTGVRFKFS